MLVAKIIDGAVVDVADYRAMFISNVFPDSGPTDEWMAENGVMRVNVWRDHDPETQKLIACDPVIEGDWVYTVAVAQLTEEELAARAENKRLVNAQRARVELEETDWCEMPSVRNTEVNPHLLNGADFDAYRLTLRAIVINPPVEVTTWPTRPDGVWSEVPATNP